MICNNCLNTLDECTCSVIDAEIDSTQLREGLHNLLDSAPPTEPTTPPRRLRKDGRPAPPLKKKGQKRLPAETKRITIPSNFTTIQAMEMMQKTLYRQVIRLNNKGLTGTLQRHEVEMIKIIKNMLPEIKRELLLKNDAENDDDYRTQLKQAAQIAGLLDDDED